MSFKKIFRGIISASIVFGLFSFSVQAATVTDALKGQATKWQGQIIDLGPLKKFYKKRRGKGIWTDDKGLTKYGKELVDLISKAGSDGLLKKDYLRKIPKKFKTAELPKLELYLSQALWRFGRDLYAGRTTPAVTEPDIVISRKRVDIDGWLTTAGRRGPTYLIDSLRPTHLQYMALRKKLATTKGKNSRRKIIVNMERWRWLPRDLGKRHVMVNQAAFEVYIRKDSKIIDRRKVVIGKTYYKTPMFSHKIKYAEFNPTWIVPRYIAGKEFLPKLRRDRRYLEKRNYKIFDSWEDDAEELDVKSVNWSKVSKKDFPYRIVQNPGKKNALGKVKFMFPNRFKVYLHDTPDKGLFKNSSRAYSHGCIRVNNPLDFAKKLFKSQRLSESKISKILASGETTRVKLRRATPIHLAYFTLWVSPTGKMKSYKDVYGRDRLVGKILFGGA